MDFMQRKQANLMRLALSLFLFCFAAPVFAKDVADLVRDGDLIFNISGSRQSRAIQLATHSRYTHVGIIFIIDGKPLVLEAVQPVGLYSFLNWTGKNNDRHFVVKRLKERERLLDRNAIQKMKQIGLRFRGRNYDGAFSWSDERLYCSELVWKIYKRSIGIELGRLKKIKQFDLTSREMQSQLKRRYGNHIPYEEPVISPGDMFDSEKLITVYKN